MGKRKQDKEITPLIVCSKQGHNFTHGYDYKIKLMYAQINNQWKRIIESKSYKDLSVSDPAKIITPLKTELIKFSFAYKQGKYDIAYKYLLSVMNYKQTALQWPDEYWLYFYIIKSGEELNII